MAYTIFPKPSIQGSDTYLLRAAKVLVVQLVSDKDLFAQYVILEKSVLLNRLLWKKVSLLTETLFLNGIGVMLLRYLK